MNEELKNIIKEEFEKVMSKNYSENEIIDAIFNKHFIHTNNGQVYSPVKIERGYVVGVNNDSQHVNIPLKEVVSIQSTEERFKK
jgi:hypothetical protein